MTVMVHSGADIWHIATSHLREAPERVMFLTATTDSVVVTDHLLMEDHDLDLGPWCVQLTDDAQQRVLQWAAQHDGWLIEIHSHLGTLGDPARLSRVDLAGLTDWVPHVRWRRRQRPYAAMVFGPRTIDGIAWAGPRDAPPISMGGWDVAGRLVRTTGLSIVRLKEPA